MANISKLALLVGVSHYNLPLPENAEPKYDETGKRIVFSDLEGPVNDVIATSQYLTGEEFDQTILLAPMPGQKMSKDLTIKEKPTYSAIVRELEYLATTAKEGDVVWVYFAGHGAKATTVYKDIRKGTDTNEDIDHCFVPYDAAIGGKYLRDLEIGVLLHKIAEKKAVLTVIFDCCHSGGVYRTTGAARIRAVVGTYKSNPVVDVCKYTETEIRRYLGESSSNWIDCIDNFVALAACQKDEEARDIKIQGTPYGCFTYHFLEVLKKTDIHNTGAEAIIREVHDQVKSKSSQTPWLMGQVDRVLFKNQTSSSAIHMKVAIIANDSNVRMRSYAGAPLKPEDILSTVLIMSVNEHGSRAARCDKDGKLIEEAFPEGVRENSHARLMSASVLSKMEFIADDETWRRFQELWSKDLEGTSSYLRLVEAPSTSEAVEVSKNASGSRKKSVKGVDEEKADFSIRLSQGRFPDGGQEFEIEDHTGTLAPTIARTLPPLLWSTRQSESKTFDEERRADVAHLAARLNHIARFRRLKNLHRRHDSSTDDTRGPQLIEVDIKTIPDDVDTVYRSDVTRATKAEVDNLRRQTESIPQILEKRAWRFSQLGIIAMFPRDKSHYYRLEPGQTVYTKVFLKVPENLRNEFDLGNIRIVDVFRIFACTPERNLCALRMKNIGESKDVYRNAVDNGTFEQLDEILKDLQLVTRQGDSLDDEDDKPIFETVDWQFEISRTNPKAQS